MNNRPALDHSLNLDIHAATALRARGFASLALAVLLLPPLISHTQGQAGNPLTPVEIRTLTANDGAANAYFGNAVSISGNFAAVGAWGAQSGRGAVYLYARNQGGADQWQQVRKITIPESQINDHFGFSVSLSGDTLAVGAPENDEWGADAGIVYVFERNLGGADQWGLLCQVASTAHLTAGDHFGYSVSLDLNLLAVGANNDMNGGVATGAAFVFHRNYGTGWFREVARLVASDGAAGDRFGIAVAISGDRVVVGAHMDDNEQGGDAGAAYLYSRDWGGYNQWGLIRKMKGEMAQDHFGRAVAIRGPLVLVGAPDAGAYGRAYLYERNQNGPNGWGLIRTLAGTAFGAPAFGCAVAVDAQKALVGAWNDSLGSTNTGAVYVFARDEGGWGNWGQQSRITPAGGAASDYFGAAMAMDGCRALIGAHGDDPQGDISGSARLLTWTGNRWYPEQKLTHTNFAYPRNLDWFGSSVTLQDGWLAAGAPRGHTYDGWGDINEIGAASTMIFQRHAPGSPREWTIGRQLVNALTEDDDRFGMAVAMDEERLVVGAPYDTSQRGMAYVFERNQGGAEAWGELARLNQHARHNSEMVGQYVALDGDVLMLGSRGSFWEESFSLFLGIWVDTPFETDSATGGNTYIYCRDPGGQSGPWKYVERKARWTKQNVVAISGNTLVIGDASPYNNAVHIYGRNHGGKDKWDRITTLNAPGGTREWGFGGAVAIAGDTLAVGPHIPGVQGNPSFPSTRDAVYIYQRNAGGADNWGLVRELWISDTLDTTGFGCPLALTDDALLVGACGVSNLAGAVFLFERNKGGADQWGLAATFRVPDNWPWSWFGQSVSLDANLVAIGAPGDDHTTNNAGGVIVNPQAGAVYVFSHGNNHPPVMQHDLDTLFFSASEDVNPASLPSMKVATLVQRTETTDADGDKCGIAVIAANNDHGQWQYTRDGTSWQDLTVSSAANARLLEPTANIRFLPAPNFFGPVEPGLTLRAWDQTAGIAGGFGDARTPGGASPFSTQTAIFNAHVRPINDRPVLDIGTVPQLPDIYGNIQSQYNRGILVSNLIRLIVTDVDGDVCGMAVSAVVDTHGQWQYSLDAGTTWRPVAPVQAASARLLGPLARLRFMPNQGYAGTVLNGLTFAAWDQTSGANGGLGNLQTGTAFSTQTDTVTINVTPVVNHAPVLDLLGNPVFQTIPRNATANAGTQVSDLLQDWVEDVDGDECGIALAQVDTAHGSWQFSLNEGSSWINVGTVSLDAALLLGPEARLRFVPALNYTGTVLVAVIYRAWDQTSGSEGSKVDTSANGGNTALSLGSEPAPITVSSDANHAPVLAASAHAIFTTIQEDDTTSDGDRVGDLVAPFVTDADGNVCGLAIYGQDTNHGVWQYTVSKGLSWVGMGVVSSNAARLLSPNARVRFVPASRYTGTVSNGLSFRAWDRSAGTNGSTASLAQTGGATPYSTGTGQAGITVADINHAPVLSTTGDIEFTPITENQFNNPGNTVSNLLYRKVTDADRDACGIAIIGFDAQHGVWQFSMDQGRRWAELTLPRGSYARLLGPDVLVRFVPDMDFRGTIANGIHLLAWDQTKGTNGGQSLILFTGGQTPFSSTDRWASLVVNEANRPPTDVALDATTVLENQPAGTVVGYLSATDPNKGEAHTSTLVPGEGSEDNVAFAIQANTLKTAMVFDRETRAEYSIRIEARDTAGGTRQEIFVITIGDVADTAPTDLVLSPAVVEENQPIGTVVGQLTATDPDLGDTHTFALVAGAGDTDNSAFVIQDHTLKTAAVFDYETKRFYQVRIQAEDSQHLTFAREWLISVIDAKDNVPPSDVLLSPACLLDDTPADTVAGLLRAVDLNPEDTHAFTLVSGEGDTDNAAFRIEGQTLLTATAIDFTAHPQYSLRVQADDGRGGTFQKAVVIVPAELLWREDFEHGQGGWTHAADLGADTWQLVEGPHRSATHALSASGTINLSDASAISPWITIPSNAALLRLEFHQQHDWGASTPDPLDGGVLELRRQGEPWQDVAGGDVNTRFIVGSYAAEVAFSPMHPLSERAIWSGSTSNLFLPVALALGADNLAGRIIQFRWRQAIASGVVSRQWYLDDIALGVAMVSDPSVTKMTPCVLLGKQLKLTWTSLPERSYVIEATSALGTPWAAVTGNLPGQSDATHTSVSLDLSAMPGYPQKAMYFRVRSP